MSSYSSLNAHIFARWTKQILSGICYFFAEKILGGLGDIHQQAVYMGTIYVTCQTPLIDVR
jgi:hypothetical protein